MIQKSKKQTFDINILNNGVIRWALVIVACLFWGMVAVSVSGDVASFLAIIATVLFIYLGGNYYTIFLSQHRDHHNPHLKALKQMGLFLAVALLLTSMGWIGIVLTTAAAFLAFNGMLQGPSGKTATEGRYLEPDSRRMAKEADKIRPDGDPGVLVGGVHIPTLSFTTNTAIVGTIGSGKSVTMGLIARAVLPGIGSNGKRALIYDAARDWPAKLEAMDVPHIITNPFDKRCRPWDIAKDIVTDADAIALAEILVPKPKNLSDPFWIDATQMCVTAVVQYFNDSAPGQWTFRDLVLGLRNQQLILRMCEESPNLHHYAQAQGTEKTASSILASLITSMQRYDVVAAQWYKAETEFGNKPFSLEEEWLYGSSVLLLGRSEAAGKSLRALNNILFKRIGQLMMDELPEVDEPTTWMFIDEMGSLGKLDFLITAATELRKYGGALICGFQSTSHLKDNFNDKITNVILGQFNQVVALRLNDSDTEKWLQGVLGRVRFKEQQTSTSTSKDAGKNMTISYRRGEEDVLLRGEMSSIPEFKPQLGRNLRGLYMWGSDRWWCEYPPDIVKRLPPKGDPQRKFIKMPKTYQRLELWTEDDWERLGISHLMEEEVTPLPPIDPVHIMQMDDDAELDELLGEDEIRDYLPEGAVNRDMVVSPSDQAVIDRANSTLNDFAAFQHQQSKRSALPLDQQQKMEAEMKEMMDEMRRSPHQESSLDEEEEELPSLDEILAEQQQLNDEMHQLFASNRNGAGEAVPLSSEEVRAIIQRVNNELLETLLQNHAATRQQALSETEEQMLTQQYQKVLVQSLPGTMYSEQQVLGALMTQNRSRIQQFQKFVANQKKVEK